MNPGPHGAIPEDVDNDSPRSEDGQDTFPGSARPPGGATNIRNEDDRLPLSTSVRGGAPETDVLDLNEISNLPSTGRQRSLGTSLSSPPPAARGSPGPPELPQPRFDSPPLTPTPPIPGKFTATSPLVNSSSSSTSSSGSGSTSNIPQVIRPHPVHPMTLSLQTGSFTSPTTNATSSPSLLPPILESLPPPPLPPLPSLPELEQLRTFIHRVRCSFHFSLVVLLHIIHHLF